MTAAAIRFEILTLNYWEHFKKAKDIAYIYPVGHAQRLVLETELNTIQEKLHKNDT